jgi:hypothetical protein
MNMTADEIRTALDYLETNYGLAMDGEAYGLASALKDKIDLLWTELVRVIQINDPYTTEADIRYFEKK